MKSLGMARTALSGHPAAAGSARGDYCGAETAARFGTVADELAALRAGCALFDLGWRAKLIVTGGDRVRWMNGMVTNNVRDLAPGHGNYNFLLNAQGHIQGDMVVYNRGEYLLVDTDAAQAPRLCEIFEKYIIMDDVEVADAGDKLTALGVEGPKSRTVLEAAGLKFRALQPLEVEDLTWGSVGLSIVRRAGQGVEGYELWLAPANAPALWDALLKVGATPVGTEALELRRIELGIPRYGVDIRERDLPQETGQEGALNFSKGCYLGQEIVERIHSRGAVHRSFIGLRVAGSVPAPGAKVVAGGKEAGEITSAASLPSQNGARTVALGYLRRENAAPGTEVEIGGSKAAVVALPDIS
jgi:folate-binding protein YgfZ